MKTLLLGGAKVVGLILLCPLWLIWVLLLRPPYRGIVGLYRFEKRIFIESWKSMWNSPWEDHLTLMYGWTSGIATILFVWYCCEHPDMNWAAPEVLALLSFFGFGAFMALAEVIDMFCGFPWGLGYKGWAPRRVRSFLNHCPAFGWVALVSAPFVLVACFIAGAHNVVPFTWLSTHPWIACAMGPAFLRAMVYFGEQHSK